MNSKQESRYQSFRIDFDASSGSIRYLYPRSNVMDVYTTEATFQIELAETIDPLGKNPNVPHIYKKISDFGSKNQIISRLIIELDEFTKLLPKSLQLIHRYNKKRERDLTTIYGVGCHSIPLFSNISVYSLSCQGWGW